MIDSIWYNDHNVSCWWTYAEDPLDTDGDDLQTPSSTLNYHSRTDYNSIIRKTYESSIDNFELINYITYNKINNIKLYLVHTKYVNNSKLSMI